MAKKRILEILILCRGYCIVGDKSPLAADHILTKNGDGLLVSRRKSEEKRE